MITEEEPTVLKQRLHAVLQELQNLTQNLPAHSVKPSHLLRIEELEDEATQLEALLLDIGGASPDAGLSDQAE